MLSVRRKVPITCHGTRVQGAAESADGPADFVFSLTLATPLGALLTKIQHVFDVPVGASLSLAFTPAEGSEAQSLILPASLLQQAVAPDAPATAAAYRAACVAANAGIPLVSQFAEHVLLGQCAPFVHDYLACVYGQPLERTLLGLLGPTVASARVALLGGAPLLRKAEGGDFAMIKVAGPFSFGFREELFELEDEDTFHISSVNIVLVRDLITAVSQNFDRPILSMMAEGRGEVYPVAGDELVDGTGKTVYGPHIGKFRDVCCHTFSLTRGSSAPAMVAFETLTDGCAPLVYVALELARDEHAGGAPSLPEIAFSHLGGLIRTAQEEGSALPLSISVEVLRDPKNIFVRRTGPVTRVWLRAELRMLRSLAAEALPHAVIGVIASFLANPCDVLHGSPVAGYTVARAPKGRWSIAAAFYPDEPLPPGTLLRVTAPLAELLECKPKWKGRFLYFKFEREMLATFFVRVPGPEGDGVMEDMTRLDAFGNRELKADLIA